MKWTTGIFLATALGIAQAVLVLPDNAGAQETHLKAYRVLVASALKDGKIDEAERQMLEAFRENFGIAEDDAERIRQEAAKAVAQDPYEVALEAARKDGRITAQERMMLDALKEHLDTGKAQAGEISAPHHDISKEGLLAGTGAQLGGVEVGMFVSVTYIDNKRKRTDADAYLREIRVDEIVIGRGLWKETVSLRDLISISEKSIRRQPARRESAKNTSRSHLFFLAGYSYISGTALKLNDPELGGRRVPAYAIFWEYLGAPKRSYVVGFRGWRTRSGWTLGDV